VPSPTTAIRSSIINRVLGELTMDRIIAGVRRFREFEYPQNQALFQQLASKQQKPIALFITCSDSRVHPNLITQTEPGDLFLIRNAGNIVPPYGAAGGGEIATIEYAIEVLGISNIIVCGHSQCGAMNALLHPQGLDHLPSVKAWCSHAESTRRIVQQKYSGLSSAELALVATEENVLVQMNNLSTHPCVAARLASHQISVYGWYYDIGSGEVLQYDQSLGHFAELNGQANATHPLPIRSAKRVG
jgi:carbonic anhydrase